MEILKTKPGENTFHLFENLPKALYPSDSIRFKQSESINNEFLDACYVLTINNEPQARIALYNNPELRYTNLKSACIGNYESTDDKTVSEKLLSFVINEAKKKGNKFLIGPMNGSTWDNYRFSTHNNEPNFLLEPFHPVYYNQHFLNVGFASIANYSSNIIRNIVCDDATVLHLESRLAEAGVTIRNINLEEYNNELKKLYPFISSSFSTNFLYTPISEQTFYGKYGEAKKIINPEYVLIAEDKEQNIIGFVFCYNDLFNQIQKRLIMKTIARHPSPEWRGLGLVLCNRVIRIAKQKNYDNLIQAFIFEDATSTELSQKTNAVPFKSYSLFGIKL